MAKMKYYNGKEWEILDSKNADTLGGHNSEYYAKKSDLDTTVKDINQTVSKTLNDVSLKIENSLARCKVFNKAGTYTWNVPEGVELVYVTATGAGGGGLGIGGDFNNIPSKWAKGSTGGITSFDNLLSLEGGGGAYVKEVYSRDFKRDSIGEKGVSKIPIYGHNGTDGKHLHFDRSKYIGTSHEDIQIVNSFRNNSDFGKVFNSAGGGGVGGEYLPRTTSESGDVYCFGGSGAYVIDCPVIVKDKTKITITIGKGGKGGAYKKSESNYTIDGQNGEDGLLIVRW